MKNEHGGKKERKHPVGDESEREREKEARLETSEKKNRSWWVHLKPPKIHSCCSWLSYLADLARANNN